MENELTKQIQTLTRKIEIVQRQQLRPVWVKASDIIKRTGWNKEQMRKARKLGWIEYNRKDGFNYNLNSLDQRFITHPRP